MNTKTIAAIIMAGVLLVGTQTSFAYGANFQNLDFMKEKLVRYHDSGRYAKELAAVDNEVLRFLQMRVKKAKPNEKLAIVLDIDETSLSNYSDMASMNFGGTNQQIDDAEARALDPAIDGTLALYQFAKSHNVAVFFVTGRHENIRLPTMQNLTAAGYQNFDGLTLKPDNYSEKSVVPYKAAARKAIAAKGYTIILNIGDQKSDLAGGYAEKSFKLPDPFYYIA
jgi:predicted secreted acid phosphatase